MPYRNAEEIAYLYGARVLARGPAAAMAREVSEAYDGGIPVPLPELTGLGSGMGSDKRSAAANFIRTGIDRYGQLITSVTPGIHVPPLRAGFDSSEKKAARKRRAVVGWMEHNQLDIKDGRRARQYVAFGDAPVIVRPSGGGKTHPAGVPFWQVLNPLSTFAAETANPDDVAPDDCIFAYRRTYRWLERRYPDEMARVLRPRDGGGDDLYDVLEYADDERLCLVVLSPAGHVDWGLPERSIVQPQNTLMARGTMPGARSVGLERAVTLREVPNRVGMCPVVVPGRIELNETRHGQFDGAVGMYRIRAMLWALNLIAVKRGVLPEVWVASPDPNQPARIVVAADPEKGVVGEIQGGDIKEFRPAPDFANLQAIDRLLEQERMEGGVPAEMTGLSASNVRTGVRGRDIFAVTVDETVAEAQRVFARARQHELRIAINTAKAYDADARRTFWVGSKGVAGQADYIPSRDFETDYVAVEYPVAGADMGELTVIAGQLNQMGGLATEDLMELHPLVKDVERTKQRITAEALDRAGLSAVESQAAQGQLASEDIARMAELVSQGKTWWEARRQAQREAQERQSPEVGPVSAGAPEAMPGMDAAGVAGAEAGVAAPAAPPSADGLAQLLGQLGPSANVSVG